MAKRRIHLNIRGIVQGVGFRPFLHRLTERYALSGWVRNTSAGVELELEGEDIRLEQFVSALQSEQPPLAVIVGVERTDLPASAGYEGFRILESEVLAHRQALVSPDVSTCPDCLKELYDTADRRYRYPFLNCTNCGPRFTIIRDMPYDRPRTSMGSFPMCEPCEAEYGNIADRRYHAQPTCCPDCGPALHWVSGAGERCNDAPLEAAKSALRRGEIVAIKGLGGFHLACLPESEIVSKLRRRKHRDEKPFALMCADMDAARKLCEISPEEEALLTGWRRPIVLLRKKAAVPAGISDNRELGLMLPYTPLHYLLMEDFPALIMTSANLSDDPVIIDNDQAVARLQGIADGFLLHNRDITTRCDDSLLRVFRGKDYPIRRSRGYAPQPLILDRPVAAILACGAEQKASFCISRGDQIFPAQHIGDLKNIATLTHYEDQITHFEELFDIRPQALVCDLHPDYLSTRYAQERARRDDLPLLQVQHHHAHMVSCMADNGLEGECIGLIWDGTGYGSDGTVWGGECLVGDAREFRRVGSLRPIPLPGGDLCTKDIGRVTQSLLWDTGLPMAEDAAMLRRQLEAGLNCPVSSGMGRLFDGVYALLTGRTRVTYEGQGAILLEAMAEETNLRLPTVFYEEDGVLRLDHRALTAALLEGKKNGIPAGELAAAFMDALIVAGVTQCRHARERTGCDRVVLSGGVFQNMYLLPRLLDALQADGFTPYHHSRVSANDEGIALGQLVIADALLRKEAP
ncbi:MAG: carbamoyltransferase HypF [Ruminococcaceae bacterium]|nr:carbamoyltransferase HypF [Oscillospiraceae bacterium]